MVAPPTLASLGRMFSREEESSSAEDSNSNSQNAQSKNTNEDWENESQPLNPSGSSQRHHLPNKPPLYPASAVGTYVVNSPTHPDFDNNNNKSAAPMDSLQYRQRKRITPPANMKTPFDESSEEPSMDRSLESTNSLLQQEHPSHHRITVQQQPQTREEEEDSHPQAHNQEEQSGQEAQAWDSTDRRQFPMLEIQRMKNKTNKLRGSSSSSSATHDFHASFDPHAGIQVITPVTPSPREGDSQLESFQQNSSNTSNDGGTTQGSGSAQSTVTGHSVRSRDATKPMGHIWSKKNKSKKNVLSGSWDSDSGSLGDILDRYSHHHQQQQPTKPTNIRNAEQSLRQSFLRPGRRHRTPSPSTSNESRNPSVSDSPGGQSNNTRKDSNSNHPSNPFWNYDDDDDEEEEEEESSNGGKRPVYPVRGIGDEPDTPKKNSAFPLHGNHSIEASDITSDDANGETTTVEETSYDYDDSNERDDDDASSLPEIHGQDIQHEEENDDDEIVDEEHDLTLHDLCGEASSTDDIAWRNALYVLSHHPKLASVRDAAHHGIGRSADSFDESPSRRGWAPLHIACLGMLPPPSYMTRALLYANPQAARWRDDGGRLPLHLLAASSADVRTMELLLQVWPDSIWKRDNHGNTPLHLLLLNKSVQLTAQNVAALLGLNQSMDQRQQLQQQQQRFILQRRGQHLKMTLNEMEQYRQNQARSPVTILNKDFDESDNEWRSFPADVQVSLRNLAKWRRQEDDAEVQRRLGHGKATAELCGADDEEEDAPDYYGETNPAAIPHCHDLKLPIHLAVQRGVTNPESVQEEEDPYSDDFEDEESDYGSDQEVSTQRRVNVTPDSAGSSVEDVYNVLRCIIAAFPEGLCVRDAEGKTPLLHIMTMTHGLPNLDLIELLLGKRTGAFEEIPPWLSDLPLHSITTLPASHNQFLSPAMVSSARTRQLPLHIAAEEFHTDTGIVESIYKSYPAATDVQDNHGRTPLHLVFSNYRVFPADPKVISALLTDSSAKTQDADGNLPFDMLVEAAPHLPKRLPNTWEADNMASVYQKFFSASLLAAYTGGKRPTAELFLRQLRRLPPWIRRQACSVSFVQELIVEELSSPLRTACVVLDGILLVITLVLFRLEVKHFTIGNSGSIGDEPDRYPHSVQVLVSFRVLILLVRAVLATNVGQLYYLILLNGWYWVDMAAMVSAFTTAMLFAKDNVQASSVLTLATVSTGLLWLAILAFGATWFFGMALLLGSLSRIANQLLWPIIGLGMMVVAFAQMFFTLLWTDCENAIPVSQVCTMRDAYRVVYLLLSGDSLVDTDGSEEIANEAILLIAGFLILLVLLAMAALVAVIMGAMSTNTEDVAFRSFWEPKLAFVISSSDWGCKRKPKLSLQPTIQQGLETRLEHTWDVLLSSLLFGSNGSLRTEKNWYASRSARGCMSWPLWLVALVVLPLWFLVGFLTLGFLWPPQLRRMLFRPLGWDNKRRSPTSAAEHAAAQLSDVKSELVRVKTMAYERSVQVEREVQDVKLMLQTAMSED